MDPNAASGSGSNPPTQIDHRTLIWPENEGFLPAKNGVSVFMKQKFKRQIFLGGYTWRLSTNGSHNTRHRLEKFGTSSVLTPTAAHCIAGGSTTMCLVL